MQALKRVLVLVTFTMSTLAYSSNDPSLSSTQQEINHLLQFVQETPCQYERNGSIHTGQEAVEHITKKYRYFEDDTETAEDFIELSATKSTLSGRHYQVHCPNQASQTSKHWLLAELTKFRSTRSR